VRQPRVAASSSFSEPIHTLGFEWFARDPGLVYLDAGADFGARNGAVVIAYRQRRWRGFRADQPNPLTKRDRETHTESSRFSVTFDHFQKIASARIVKCASMGSVKIPCHRSGPAQVQELMSPQNSHPFLSR